MDKKAYEDIAKISTIAIDVMGDNNIMHKDIKDVAKEYDISEDKIKLLLPAAINAMRKGVKEFNKKHLMFLA